MADIRMAVGETLPVFNATLTFDGAPRDLTSATVTFDLTKHGRGYINDAPVTVLSAPDGTVRYTWATGDLTETGTYVGTFKASFPGPLIEYFEFVIDVIDGEGIQPAPTPPVPTTYVLSVNGRTGVVVGVLDAAANLSDVASAASSRTNLGLGNSATRDVGTTVGTVAAGDDSRFTDPPTGAAGGVLGGTYPNPSFAVDMATQAESDAAVATRQRLHGFPNRTDTNMAFNPASRSFIIAPTGASFTFHINGVLFTKTAEGLTTTATDGPHYVYYNSSGVLTHSTTVWNILTDVPVALVVWSTTANTGFLLEERHGDVMDASTHDYLHATRGTQVKARPTLTGYTVSPGSPADADNTPAIASDGILADEDIYSTLAAVTDGGGANGYSVLWRTGAAEWTWTTGRTVPFVNTAAGYINANTLSGTWSQVQLANNQYVNYWLLAVPAVSADVRYQYFFIPGQTIHTSLANAQAESVGSSLVLTGLPFTEFAFTHRVTFRTSNTYASTGKCRIEGVSIVVESVATITAAAATAAASVTNTPAGNIAATNVQAALNELDSEKVAKAGDTMTGPLGVGVAASNDYWLHVGGTIPGVSTPQIGLNIAYTSATTATSYGMQIAPTVAAGVAASLCQGFRVIAIAKGAGASLTNAYGFTVSPQTAGTNNYSAVIGASSTQTVWLSYDADNTTAAAGIAFGVSRDTNLYRSAANTLKTDDDFQAAVITANTRFTGGEFRLTAATAGTDIVLTNVTGDSAFRFDIYADGKLEWGPGNASRDTNLYRSAANVLKTDDALVVGGASITLADPGNLVLGTTTGTKIGTATNEKLAFHNSAPVIQRAGAAQAAVVTTAATNSTPYGFTTAAQADAIVTLVNELRAALVEKGLIKGAA